MLETTGVIVCLLTRQEGLALGMWRTVPKHNSTILASLMVSPVWGI